ncbi:MAG: hypothetical protein Q8P41_27420 [Pseudomonadota bacterium]|nr:hypothetical protein [Pseudomonadota bacterium]
MLALGVADPVWLAFHRSALARSVGAGCRAGASVDPGVGDAGWAALETSTEAAILDALADAGAACEPHECAVTITSFGRGPARTLGCTVSRDFSPLTPMVLDPVRIESTTVVRMEWQR